MTTDAILVSAPGSRTLTFGPGSASLTVYGASVRAAEGVDFDADLEQAVERGGAQVEDIRYGDGE